MSARADLALRVRVGGALIDATATAQLTQAITAWNDSHRIASLPDALNPALIDPDKTRALLAALEPDASVLMGGRALDLNPRTLLIGASAPTTPVNFQPPVKLTIESEHGESVSARADVAPDCILARARATQARALTATEPAGPIRYAVAQVWWENADAVVSCAPGDAAATSDRDAAIAAAKASMILGGSMQ